MSNNRQRINHLLSLVFDVVFEQDVQLIHLQNLIVMNKHHNNLMMKDYCREHYEVVQKWLTKQLNN